MLPTIHRDGFILAVNHSPPILTAYTAYTFLVMYKTWWQLGLISYDKKPWISIELADSSSLKIITFGRPNDKRTGCVIFLSVAGILHWKKNKTLLSIRIICVGKIAFWSTSNLELQQIARLYRFISYGQELVFTQLQPNTCGRSWRNSHV